MTPIIDEVLELLACSKSSYSIEDVARTLNIPITECEVVLNFLAKYGFIHYYDQMVQITPEMRKFVIDTSLKVILQISK